MTEKHINDDRILTLKQDVAELRAVVRGLRLEIDALQEVVRELQLNNSILAEDALQKSEQIEMLANHAASIPDEFVAGVV